MFKSHELVVKLEKAPKRKRINDIEMDVDSPREAKPVSIPRDPWFELRMFVEESTPKIVRALVAYKLCTTAIRAAEHIVVTKVK